MRISVGSSSILLSRAIGIFKPGFFEGMDQAIHQWFSVIWIRAWNSKRAYPAFFKISPWQPKFPAQSFQEQVQL